MELRRQSLDVVITGIAALVMVSDRPDAQTAHEAHDQRNDQTYRTGAVTLRDVQMCEYRGLWAYIAELQPRHDLGTRPTEEELKRSLGEYQKAIGPIFSEALMVPSPLILLRPETTVVSPQEISDIVAYFRGPVRESARALVAQRTMT